MTTLVFVAMFIGFNLLGRWLQFHPEKVFPEGAFISEDTRGAKLAKAQIAVLGIFMVVLGTGFALYSVLQLLTFDHWILNLLAVVIAASLGIAVAKRVRTEAKARPPHHSTNPHGWWP